MGIDTKPNFSCTKFEQCSGDVMNLSGCTQIYGIFDIETGATLSICENAGVGKLLTSNATGVATWETAAPQGVTVISGGSGMNFSPITSTGEIILGTPSAILNTSTDVSSGTTHHHSYCATTFITGTQGILVDGSNRFYLDDTYISNSVLPDLYTFDNVTSNQSLGSLSSNQTLGMVYITNTGSTQASINLGTTTLGNDITPYQPIDIGAGEDVSVTVNMRLSITESKTIYINSDSWTNVALNVQWANVTFKNVPLPTGGTGGLSASSNGLNDNGDTVKLGGTLTENTCIAGSGSYGISMTGLTNFCVVQPTSGGGSGIYLMAEGQVCLAGCNVSAFLGGGILDLKDSGNNTQIQLGVNGDTRFCNLATKTTESDVVYINSSTGRLVTGAGGGGTPAGSDTYIQFNDTGSFGADIKLNYDNSNNAFTAGWRCGTVGQNSVVLGGSQFWGELDGYNQASGCTSIALGIGTCALGEASMTWGIATKANARRSTAWGDSSQATADMATAWGNFAQASGVESTAWGDNTQAVSAYTTSFGYWTCASQTYATAWGDCTHASGITSTAFGNHTKTIGTYSTAWGQYTEAHDFNETALGCYNIIGTGSITGWVEADNLFTIGNGTFAGGRSNALQIKKSGNLYLPNITGCTASDVLYYDSSDGSVSYGTAPSGGTGSTSPGGADGAMQYNNGSNFGGTCLNWDDSTNHLGYNVAAQAGTMFTIQSDISYDTCNTILDLRADDGLSNFCVDICASSKGSALYTTTICGYGENSYANLCIYASSTVKIDSGLNLPSITESVESQVLYYNSSTNNVTYGAAGSSNEALQFAVSDETTDLTTGTNKITFRMPYAMTLTEVRASVGTAPTGANLVVDINQNAATILSTKLSIDAGEKTSTTATTAAVISTSALTDDAEITVDIDTIGSSVAGAGLKITFKGTI